MVNMNKNYIENGNKSFISVLAVLLMLGLNTEIAAAVASPVSSCTTIAVPGTYELTENIINSSESSCIKITSSHVIFNGKSHKIDGISSYSSNGVIVYNSKVDLKNVTVKNLIVTNWDSGIEYRNVKYGTIKNNNVQSNTVGILLKLSNHNLLKNNIAKMTPFGGMGFGIYSSKYNTLTGNRAIKNGGTGIILDGRSNYNNLVDNNASLNGDMGIWILGKSSYNTLTNNKVFENGFCCGGGRAGIAISSSNYTTLTSNTIKTNLRGVAISSSNNIQLLNNVINSNTQSGLDIVLSSLIVK